MQSNQSKLLIAGIVAAQVGATSLEAEYNPLVEQAAAENEMKTLLAQIQDDPDNLDDIPSAPSNANTNTTEARLSAAVPGVLETTDLNAKIDLITDAAMGGLNAKSEWIMTKLDNYADEKLGLFKKIDESCR
jgi:hypothetical protein